MYRFLSKSGRLLLGENRYQAIRKQVFRWIRGGKRKKYAKIRKEFFRQSRHKEEYQNIYRARTTHLVTIDQPLVLISQVARSGGTLLKRLFDNYQQCHVYPVELAMGIRPDVYDYAWPLLDLTSDSHAWLKSLVQIHIWRWLNDDFRYWLSEKESHPLIILPLLCERIFLDCVSKRIIKSDRDVFDCYMTALFNSWIDNQNLYSTIPKKYVVAFAPKMGLEHDNIKRFFSVYPDGVYISIIRDPRNWYASALNYRTWEFNDLDASFQSQWNKSTQLALDIWRERPNQVALISFEVLIQNTEGTM
jgi:hypothetical protein